MCSSPLPLNTVNVAFCQALSSDFHSSALFRVFFGLLGFKKKFFIFFGAQTNLKNIPASFGGSEENTQYSTSREGYSNTYRLQRNTQNEPSLLFTNNFKFQDWIRSFQDP